MKLASPSPRRRLWVVNYRLAAATFAGAVALFGAAVGWHGYQVERIAAVFLQEAETWERRKDWRQAAEALYRYSRLTTDSHAVAIRRARNFDRATTSQTEKTQAIQLYQEAIPSAPDDPSLHRRLAELLLETGDYAAALVRAEVLLSLRPDDAAACRVKALAMAERFAQGWPVSRAAVVEELREAQRRNPADLPLAVTTAEFLRRNSLNAEAAERAQADAVLDEFVRRFPERSDAWLARFSYRLRHRLPGADDDLAQALQLAPRDPEALLAAAALRVRDEQWPEAEKLYRRAVYAAPHDPRGRLGLGDVMFAVGRREEAVEIWRHGVQAARGHDVLLQLRLARGLIALGRLDEADAALIAAETAMAFETGPPDVTARRRQWWTALRASWRVARGEFAQAAPLLEQWLARYQPRRDDPSYADEHWGVLLQLGDVYEQLGKWALAAETYGKAVALRPSARAPRLARAEALRSARKLPQALAAYRDAAAASSDDPEAVGGLIDVLLELAVAAPAASDDPEAAPRDSWLAEALRRADEIAAQDSQAPLAHLRRAQALALLDRAEEADEEFARAVELGGDDLRFHLARIAFDAQHGRTAEARQALEQLAARAADAPLRRARILAEGRRAIGDRQTSENRQTAE